MARSRNVPHRVPAEEGKQVHLELALDRRLCGWLHRAQHLSLPLPCESGECAGAHRPIASAVDWGQPRFKFSQRQFHGGEVPRCAQDLLVLYSSDMARVMLTC